MATYDRNTLDRLRTPWTITPVAPPPLPRCRTGYVLTSTKRCELCGAGQGEPCRQPGTA